MDEQIATMDIECKSNRYLLIAIFHGQISLDIFHEVLEPLCHCLLLVQCLRPNDVLFERSMVEQSTFVLYIV